MYSVFGTSKEEYEFYDAIGQGGFGKVFRGRCKKTDTIVAIKKIDRQRLNGKLRKRVHAEISIQSRLDHPSILKLYTSFEDETYVYIVIEFCPNGDLLRHMRSIERAYTENEARDYLSQVVDGTLYLHSLDIIHRDLTLCNVLLDSDNRIKIADFGLATMLRSPQERQMTMCGTPNYMSPEVATMSSHGLETDVWSLGCMLYTMLVGVAPFETKNKQLTMEKVANVDYKIPDYISEVAGDLIMKCLTPNPETRITSEGIRKHPFFGTVFRVDSGVYTISTTATTHHTRIPFSALSENVGSFSARSRLPSGSGRLDRLVNSMNTPPVRLKSSPVEYVHQPMFGTLKKKFAGLPELVRNEPLGAYYILPQNGTCHSLPQTNAYAQSLPKVSLRERDISEERRLRECGPSGEVSSSLNKQHNSPHSGCGVSRNSQRSYDSGLKEIISDSAGCRPTSGHFCRSKSQERELAYLHKSEERSPVYFLKSEEREPVYLPTTDVRSSSKEIGCSPRSKRSSSLDSLENVPNSPNKFSQHPPDCRCIDCTTNCCTCKSASTHRSWCNKGLHPVQVSPHHSQTNNPLSHRSNKIGKSRSNSPTFRQVIRKLSPVRNTSSLSFNLHTKDVTNTKRSVKTNTSTDKRKNLESLCSPIKTARLKPYRQEYNSVVLHILKDGHVCMESLQIKENQKRVESVFRIFEDGKEIVVYEPKDYHRITLKETPPDIPQRGNNKVTYGFTNLPKKHWKKYIKAAKFVKMIKSKTPKLVYYSDLAKCLLMENSTNADFEATFYSGEKFLLSGDKIHFTNGSSNTISVSVDEGMDAFNEDIKAMYQHFMKAKKYCLRMEEVISLEDTAEHSGFPATLGCRPAKFSSTNPPSNRKPGGKENRSPGGISTYRGQSSMAKNLGTLESSIASVTDRPSRAPKPLTPNQDVNINAGSKKPSPRPSQKRQYIKDIGWALNDGRQMKVDYLDGSAFHIEADRPELFLFTDNNNEKHYYYLDAVPKQLLHKVGKFHEAMKLLSPHS